MDTGELIIKQNAEVKRWSSMVTRKLKTSASRFQHGKSGMVMRGKKSGYPHEEDKLNKSLNAKIYKRDSLAEGIGIRFERHGVFVQKGVGRGYIANGGTVTRGFKNRKEAKQYAGAKNRAVNQKTVTGGSINRKPNDWFNAIMQANVPELFNKIIAINGDAVLNEMHIMIK